MKTIYLLALTLVLSIVLTAQNWTQNLPQDRLQNGELKLPEIQKAFNDYWEPYNVENGYYYVNGEKIKAPGWKQFKRWEWKAEYLIDGEGNFPETSTVEEMEKYNQKYPDAGKSLSGNWSNIGYNTTPGGYQGIGRVNCIAFHPTNTSTFWIGAPSGGLWKTTDGGSTWSVLTDNNTVLGVSAIAVTSNYATSNTLYIGTGDRDGGSVWTLGGGNTHDNEGVGVLKSTNGGTTWTSSLAFNPSQKYVIYDLLIDPGNNNKLYAATSIGIYYTTNGGTSWTLMHSTVCTDLEFQPGNSNVFYGAYYQWVMKHTWTGTSWTWASPTLPGSSSSRTEIAVSANNSSVVYALTVNSGRGLEAIYKSTNSGVSYTSVFNGSTAGNNLLGYNCTPSTTTGQGTYDVFITANPSNANDVYVGGINVWRIDFSGTAPFTATIKSHWSGTCSGTVNTVHADQHCCEFRPGTSDIYLGNDGGIYKSTDYGSNWTDLSNGLTINQIYRLGLSANTSNEIIIGLQDNGTHLYSGGSWISNAVLGGDGMECLIQPYNNNVQFGSYHSGEIIRTSTHWSGGTINVRTNIRNATGGSPGLTGHWVTPFMLDPNNSSNLFVGFDQLWKSTDQGVTSTNFSKISSFSMSGATIRSIKVAPSNSNYIYAGFLNKLYKTTNGGTSWTDITSGLPVTSGNITYIEVKNNNYNTVWVTIGGFNSHAVYQTFNGGTTWTNISSGLPQIPAMSIVQNVQNTNFTELYVAMTQGVWVKYGSSNWIAYKTGLPNVLCAELEIYYDNSNDANSRIRVGTFGRGIWESGLPVVDFYANNTLPVNSTTTVNFTDASTNGPTGWSWSFSPTTVTYVGGTNSTSQNPQVRFNNTGPYSVSLTTTNTYGTRSKTKTAYIHMGTPGLWTGTTSTNWHTTTNWHNQMVPISSIGVTIDPSASSWPTYSGNLVVGTHCNSLSMAGVSQLTVTGDLTVQSGKQFFCGSNATINVTGDFHNYGTFTPGMSQVNMNGNTNSTITANAAAFGGQTTTYTSGFGPWAGCYFDILATGPKNISVDSFDIHSSVIGPVNVQVWYTMGSYAGNTGNPAVWTQLGTTQMVTGNGPGLPTPINPGASLTIPTGQGYGFYINCYTGTNGHFYFGAGNNSYVNVDMTVNTGDITNNIPVATGGTLNGYTFNGTVYYSAITLNSFQFWDLFVNKSNATVTANGNLNIGNDFYLRPNAYFTNSTGNSLNVMGNTFIEADPTGMASYLDNGSTSGSGNIFVEQFITSQQWHLVSPPVSGATINVYYDIYLKQYNEPTDTWTYLVNPTTTGMNTAQGYSAWASDSYTGSTIVTYNGSLNNADFPISSLSYTSSAAKAGFNLIGNPYPCALDWNSNWTTSNLSGWAVVYDNGTFRGWHPTSGSYNGKTNGVIPSTQGFWVRALNSSGSLTIPASERLHSNQAFYKETLENIYPTVRLESEINELTDETVIVFHPECSPGFDGYWDLSKFTNVDEAPTIYSISGNEKYGVNFYDENYPDKIIPVGFNTGVEGIYSITATEIINFDGSINIYLEDLKTGTITILNETPIYDFSYDPMDEEHRFNLHFKDEWFGIEGQDISGINIYAYKQVVYVRMGEVENGQVRIFNIMGQDVEAAIANKNSLTKIPVNAGMGYYLVKVMYDNQIVTEKVLIQ